MNLGPPRPTALLLTAFGGPEGPDDVEPFLAHVADGRAIPPERLAEVADRYATAGGRSPINERMRRLAARVGSTAEDRGVKLAVACGNRHWHPFIDESVRRMWEGGHRDIAAWITSPYRSYATCRSYLEGIDAATAGLEDPAGPVSITPIRTPCDHPGLIEPAGDRLADALASLAPDVRHRAHVLFTAHSIPEASAATCDYEADLRAAAALVADRADPAGRHPWELVWQSRSGPPDVPWLAPDVGDRIDELAAAGVPAVAVSPIGFPVLNFEILWDLDHEAARRAEAAGMAFGRAATVDDDPRFAAMIFDLFTACVAVNPAPCPVGCCPPPSR